MSARPGRQFVEPLGHVRQIRETGAACRACPRPADCAPSAASDPGRPSCPSACSCPSRPCENSCGRTAFPSGRPSGDIILRASKKRSTSWLTSETVTPEPLAIRSRREALMIFGSARSCRRHAADDGLHPVELTVVDGGQRVLHLAGPGQHAQQVADRTHLADREHLLEEVLQRQLAAADLGGRRLGLLGVEVLLGLLDQAQHVAHAQNPAGHPVGVEDVEVLELLAAGGEQDRHPGDLAHRQRGATAGVAVELGQHHAGESDALTERVGGGHRVLTDHRVEDEQCLVGLRRHRGSPRPGSSAPRRCPVGRPCRR